MEGIKVIMPRVDKVIQVNENNMVDYHQGTLISLCEIGDFIIAPGEDYVVQVNQSEKLCKLYHCGKDHFSLLSTNYQKDHVGNYIYPLQIVAKYEVEKIYRVVYSLSQVS